MSNLGPNIYVKLKYCFDNFMSLLFLSLIQYNMLWYSIKEKGGKISTEGQMIHFLRKRTQIPSERNHILILVNSS